jgi:hypothetical protein
LRALEYEGYRIDRINERRVLATGPGHRNADWPKRTPDRTADLIGTDTT